MEENTNCRNKIDEVLATAMSKIKTLIDVNTVIGQPQDLGDGVTIIPVSKISLGFLAGGGEYGENNKKQENEENFAGGSGACASMNPIGFLVSTKEEVKFLKIDNSFGTDKIMETAFELFEKAGTKVREKCEKIF